MKPVGKTPRRLISLMDSDSFMQTIDGQISQKKLDEEHALQTNKRDRSAENNELRVND